MKAVLICPFILIVFFSCKKDTDTNCLQEISMKIQYTVTPGVAATNSSFDVRFGVTGANLCYKLLRTDLIVKPNNVFEVRPIGTIPCRMQVCAEALYQAADTVSIPTRAPGTYRVEYYSENALLASQNVIVN